MKRLLLFAALSATIYNASAYDFSAVAPSGQTLYYNIVDGHAEIVRPSSGSPYSAYVSGDLIIPASVTYNGATYSVTVLSNSEGGTFRGCGGLISVTIPSSVTAIGNYAFYQCTGLEDVIFANGLQTIGKYAFQECHSLDSINLPNGLTTIGNGAFRFCSNLSHVIFPSSLTTIGESAFIQCPCKNIIIPDIVQIIGRWAFSGIRHIEYHGTASGAPWGAWSMNGFEEGTMIFEDSTKSRLITYFGDTCCVTIPYSVVTIGPRVFYGCSEIEWVVVPSNVVSIGEYAFHGCSSNLVVWMNPIQPPVIENGGSGSSIFDSTLFLIVPRVSYNTYTQTNSPYWRARKFMDTSYVSLYSGNILSGDQSKGFTSGNDTVVFPDTISIISATPYYGYHFSKWSDNNTNNPRTLSVSHDINLTAHFSDNYYNLSVNPNITTYGTCNGGGNYTYLSVRSFSANANYGYHFVQWNDGDTNNNRTITLTQDTIYTAIFAKNHYSVTGITTDSVKGFVSEGATVEYLDTVTLTATANYGYHFVRWNDNNTDNPRKIVATSNITKTAIFDYNQYSLNVQIDTSIHGTVNGTGNYNYLSERTINANANYGYYFTAWNDGDTSNPRTITLTQDTAFTALFAKNTYTITAISADSIKGTVTGSTSIAYLDSVTIIAIPNYGYHFTVWNDGNSDNPRTIVATGDILFTASFGFNQYIINLYADTNIHGAVDGSGYYNYLSGQTITATANYGYHFTAWSDGDTNNPRTITLTQDTQLVALFSKNLYSVAGETNDSVKGMVVGSDTVEYLDTVTLVAIPKYGYHFYYWRYTNDNGYSSYLYNTDTLYLIATRDKSATAYFTKNNYSISLFSDTVRGAVWGAGEYNYFSERTISATANNGYHFTAWNDGDTNNPRTITLTQDTIFTALFAKNIYSITAISADTIKGAVTGSTSIEYLDSVTIVAIPNYGYHFTAWNDGNTDNPRVIVATRDSLFTATFDHNQYTITLNVDTGIHGSVVGVGSYNYLSEQTITATANYGYHFTAWSDGDTNNPRTIILTQDTIFTALFAKNTYTITAISADTIKGSVNGSTSIEYLDSVTIVASPNYGYHFTAWNDGNADNPRVIVATRDSLFTATFDHNQYTITLNVDTGIHGSVVGVGSYNYLSEQTITAMANYGYHFTDWNDGDTNNPRTITLTQDTIFTALFAKNIYSITAISADTIKGAVTGSTSIEYLDSVTIMANPNYGYHFTTWDDGNTDNPRTIVATRDSVFAASFGYNQYTIALYVDTDVHGAVIGDGSYNYLSEQTITAMANYGYHFTGWSDGDTNNPRTIILTQDTALTALFAKNQYTLTLQSEDVAHGGVIGGGVFEYLDTVAIEATSVEHYHFVQWNDGNTDNPRQYVITRDDTIIATFAIDTHHVSVESCNIAFGSVGGSGDFEYGTPATVTATGYSGYQFVRWSDGSTYNPYTFAVLHDTTLVAIFEAETQGIDDAFPNAVNVYTIGSQIVVVTELKDEISIYDIVGRKVDGGRKTRFDVPASGVYLVKIGTLPTQKVVVVK